MMDSHPVDVFMADHGDIYLPHALSLAGRWDRASNPNLNVMWERYLNRAAAKAFASGRDVRDIPVQHFDEFARAWRNRPRKWHVPNMPFGGN